MSLDTSIQPSKIEHRGVESKFPLVRETPADGVLFPAAGPARPDVSASEPLLRVWDIQGNIIAGFNKDFQTLLFLRIGDVALFKKWLKRFAPLVASAEEVIAFNRLFKWTSDRRGYRGSVKASWIN